jgi:hypothetical protein
LASRHGGSERMPVVAELGASGRSSERSIANVIARTAPHSRCGHPQRYIEDRFGVAAQIRGWSSVHSLHERSTSAMATRDSHRQEFR